MHFSSPYTTVDDWSRHKAQTTDNMFPSSLALPGQPIQQIVPTAVTTPPPPLPAASTAPTEGGVPGAQRNSNTFLDGPFQDFMPYQPFQQFDDLTINHLHQSNKSPSQSPQIQQQQQQQQQQLHQLQFQQQQHHQPIQQHPSWADQRYPQTYMPVTTTSTSMGQSAYYNQQQQSMPHQIQQHMQQQQQQHHHLQQQQQQQQQRSLPPSQHMPYPQQHQMLPHQQQAFLGSLNPSPQQLHRQHHPYPGLPSHDTSPHGLQHQLQQAGRKRKDVNDYMVDGTMAVPVKKPKKKKKKAKEPEDPNAPPKPKRKTGLNKPLILSAPLSALMDDEVELSRPEIVKRLWKYIKGNDLQDPKDRRFILCDDKLKTIFHVERVNSFGMNKDLSKHLTKKEVPEEQPLSASSTATTSSSSSLSTSATDETTATSATNTNTNTSTHIKQSPTVTAETPDDVVTPQEGEHVHLLTDGSINSSNSLATPSNPLTSESTALSNTASSTPLLHSLLH